MHEEQHIAEPVPLNQVLEKAASILAEKYARQGTFTNPDSTKAFLKLKLAGHEREVFAVMFLDNQHRMISFKELFWGTIDSAHVFPREVIKAALAVNAAAVILSHNHPSGVPEPSIADKAITTRLQEALTLVDVRVLDHIVVGESCVSFAERGWL